MQGLCAQNKNLEVFTELKCLSWNVRGLSERVKRKQVFNYINEKNIDFALLQETHFVKKKRSVYKTELGGNIVFSDGESNARGVAICINR